MWIFGVAGLPVILLGINAYRGVYRGWMVRPGIYLGYLGPAALVMGIGLLLIGLAETGRLWAQAGPTTMSGIIGAGGFFGGLAVVVMGHFFAQVGMPARLLPGWVRDIEGLPTRPRDPDPDISAMAPDWTSLKRGGPGCPGTVPADPQGGTAGYRPPLEPVSGRTGMALEFSLYGKARTKQKEGGELDRLRSWGLLDEKHHPTLAGSLMLSRVARRGVDTYRVAVEPEGRRVVLATRVDDVTVLEFRQDWDGRRTDLDVARVTWDVVPMTDPMEVEDLAHHWLVSAP